MREGADLRGNHANRSEFGALERGLGWNIEP